MMPKVSVIVPVYNTEKYLRRCMDSLTAQTLRELEIILVDLLILSLTINLRLKALLQQSKK